MKKLKLGPRIATCCYQRSTVIFTVERDDGGIKRRRECKKCGERWTTFEISSLDERSPIEAEKALQQIQEIINKVKENK